MKKIKKKIALLFAAAVLCFGLSISPLTAVAESTMETTEATSENSVSADDVAIDEETPTEEKNAPNSENLELKTEDSGYTMDPELEKYLQPLICAAGGLGGTLMVVLWGLMLFRKGLKVFKEVRSWWKEKKEELANDGIDLAKIRSDIATSITSNEEVKAKLEELSRQNKEEYQAFLTAVNSAVDAAASMVKSVEASCEKRVAHCEREYLQIKEILIMIATGNGELIRRGTADEIVKKFNEEKLEVEGENVG